MDVLITGAKGQLGQDCAAVLEKENTIHQLGSGDLDIGNPDQVKHLVQTIRPDVVINCAAFTAVDECESNIGKCQRVNAEGPGMIASACARINARLIHISTDYVFDGKKTVPYPYVETDPVAPLSQYGSSKLAGEQLVREQIKNHVIIRTAWLYGTGGSNFLKTMLRLSLNDPERTLRVVDDQYGSLTWTHRLAQQIQVLLTSSLTGTIHATAEGYCTWYEGAKVFLEAMQVDHSLEACATEEYPTPAHRPANSILENSVLKRHGLNRMVPWQEDIVAFAGQYRDALLSEAIK